MQESDSPREWLLLALTGNRAYVVRGFLPIKPMSDYDQPRRTPRYKFNAQAEIIVEGSGAKQLCQVKELSLYGCYLDCPEPLSPKTRVLLKMYEGGEYFEAPANVIYSHPAWGMGIGFRDVKPAFAEVLRDWLLRAMNDSKEPQ